MRANLLFLLLIVCTGRHLQAQISARVSPYNGRPTIFINDQPEYPMFYALTDVPGGRWSWEEVPRYNLKSFCGLGVKLIQVDLAFDHIWNSDGSITTDTARRQLKGVLDVCPDAAIVIRLHVNPPKWWQRKFPEENTVYADREPKPDISWGLQRIIEDDEETPVRTSLASEKWKSEASQKLASFLSQLKELPESNALAGIQVAGGVYGEWHYWGFIENEPDNSLPMLRYFRTWLKNKYGNDKALQQSWNSKDITMAGVSLPTLRERRQTRGGIFRDPALEQNIIDYYQAQHDVVADDILLFCKVVKDHWPRPIITGAFYGYFYSLFGRDLAGGHLALQRVLRSPDIDFLCGPGTYYPNAVEMGQPYRSRSLINSIGLHHKLWLDEMDQQTPLVPLKDTSYQTSVRKSVAQVRRNVMFTQSKGQGLWFYDFGPSGFNGGPRLNDHGAFGWWDEPTVRQAIAQLKILGDRSLQHPYTSDADVLIVHDTDSFFGMAGDKSKTGITHWGNNWPVVGIFKSGIVHDVIHLDDLEKTNIDQYKAIVFLNAFLIRPDQRKVILEKVAKGGRHLVWIYAPGYSDGRRLAVPPMNQLTGIQLRKIERSTAVSVTTDPSLFGPYQFSVWNSAVSPLFVAADPGVTILGTITGTSEPAFVRKELGQSTSWFISLPPESPALWRYIFEIAQAHRYVDGEDIVYAGNGTVTLHTKDGGKKTVSLKNGKQLLLTLEPFSTTVLDSETGAILLR